MRYHMAGVLGITLLIVAGVGAYVITQKAHTNIMNTEPATPNSVSNPPRTNISTPVYGSVTTFTENVPLVFPDFTLTFTGVRTEKLEVNPNLTFTFYNFTVMSHDGRTRTLSWSSGTGSIAPKLFVVENQVYALELKFAEKESLKLNDSELVVSPMSTDYFGKKIGVSSFLFQLIAQLTPLTTQTYDTITNILGFSFTQKPLAAVYESAGFGPITHAELRTSRMSSAKKVLILTIDPEAHVSKADIIGTYPKAVAGTSPYIDAPTVLSIPGIFGYNETWGTINFGFDREDRLTSIVINALD